MRPITSWQWTQWQLKWTESCGREWVKGVIWKYSTVKTWMRNQRGIISKINLLPWIGNLWTITIIRTKTISKKS